MFNLDPRALGLGLSIRDDSPVLSNECWSSSAAATAICCKKFNSTLVTVKGSSIQACTFHDDSQWDPCIEQNFGSGEVEIQCNSHGGSSNGGFKLGGVGGLVVGCVLIAQMIGALLA